MYESLTRLISKFDESRGYGEWIVDRKSMGTVDDPIHMPWVRYGENVFGLWQAIEDFNSDHPEFELARYREILEKNSVDTSWSMTDIDVSRLSGQVVLALFMAIIRKERFMEGLMLECCESGCAKRWLERLLELDKKEQRGCFGSKRRRTRAGARNGRGGN